MRGNTSHPAFNTNSLPPSHFPTLERCGLSCNKNTRILFFSLSFQTRFQLRVGLGCISGIGFWCTVHKRISGSTLQQQKILARIINNCINWLFSDFSDKLLLDQ